MRVELVIKGEPMGKQRPYATTKNGYTRTFTPEKTLNYEALIRHEYQNKYNEMVFKQGEQLHAHIVAYFPIPKSQYAYHKKTNTTDLTKTGMDMKCGKVRPTKKPDCDNIAKICLDSLNGIAYPDDSQLVNLLVVKFYSEEPRVIITIWKQEISLDTGICSCGG